MNQDNLIQLAKEARNNAHAPYSKFFVGAVVETKDGNVFQGCNVENASYGLCNCAERTAFFSAVAAGYKQNDFQTIAVIGDTEEPIAPCGACRQVMMELGGPKLTVILTNLHGNTSIHKCADLLPGAFYLAPQK